MIKCEVIKEFTLERFNELKNVVRIRKDVPGSLFVGDTFCCEKDIADYLLGDNDRKVVVVKVIEIIPKKIDKKKKTSKK